MKKKIITIVVGIAIAILSITTLYWDLLSPGLNLLHTLSQPKIKHGQFPFHLVYEINAKRYTINDTIICDYAGIGFDEGNGIYTKWKEHTVNGIDIGEFSLGTEDDRYGIKLFDGVYEGNSTTIYYDIGSPEYYLNYKKFTNYRPGCVGISSPYKNGSISNDELWSKFKIKIIEEKFSNPIVSNGNS